MVQRGLLEPSAPPPPSSLQLPHPRAAHRGCTSWVFDQCELTSPTRAGTNQFLCLHMKSSRSASRRPPSHGCLLGSSGCPRTDESLEEERSQRAERERWVWEREGERDRDRESLPFTLKVIREGSCTVMPMTLAGVELRKRQGGPGGGDK